MSKRKQDTSKAKKSVARTSALTWEWLPRREHDGKIFGNPALYATPQTVASLVRETGQNSLDATAGKMVSMRFRLIDLPAGCERRKRFEQSIRFSAQLRPHLEAVASSKRTQASARVRRALADLDDDSRMLRLLVVEDFGTKGLQGDEFDSDGSFCALVRDTENSHKADATAGGSFGLGSKTLWACSGLRTVLFASDVQGSEAAGTRTIGKADLGYHNTKTGAAHGYVGPGFLGKSVGGGGAESVLVQDEKLLADMCLLRTPPANASQSGTSALILAFDDPESDDDDSTDTLEKLRQAIGVNFWPAMLRGSLRAYVRHEQGDLDAEAKDEVVTPEDYVPSLVEAYQKHLGNDVSDKLRTVGDVVSVPIPQVLPATRRDGGVDPEHGEVQAEARLIIRLSGEDSSADKELCDTVALARGRAMVTKYWQRKGIALNARPFHAFLLAGTLAGDNKEQVMAEQFLRHAEPPSHDEWKLWTGLKARYEHGAGRKIHELEQAITRALADHVAGTPETTDDGPDALKRLLQIPNVSVGKPSRWRLKEASVVGSSAEVEFSAIYEIDRPSGATFTPKVSLAGESGNVALKLTSLVVNGEEIEDGCVVLRKGDKKIEITGRAVAEISGIDLSRCAIRLGAQLAKVGGADVEE